MTAQHLFTLEDLTKPLKAQLVLTQNQLAIIDASLTLFIQQMAKATYKESDEGVDISTSNPDLLREGLELVDLVQVKLKQISTISNVLDEHTLNLSKLAKTENEAKQVEELNLEISKLKTTNLALQDIIVELKSKAVKAGVDEKVN